MAKTTQEIENLKKDWERDPIWDLYETEGFEEHREELKKHQEKMEAIWEQNYIESEKKMDRKAEELGIKGLYRLLIKHEELLERHYRAIEALGEGDTNRAYKALNGY